LALMHGVGWACIVDSDCTTGTGCGGQVCTFPGGVCVNAGTDPGWCHSTTECKCKGEGATCTGAFVCSFTQPQPDMAMQPPDLFGVLPPDMTGQDLTSAPADLSTAPADMAQAAASPDLSVATSCDHDTQCPGTTCGGQVCQWAAVHACVAAGTDPQGSDGWCNSDAECKCKSEGATCNLTTLHCTATLPKTGGKSGCEMNQVASPTGVMVGLGLVAVALFLRRRARP